MFIDNIYKLLKQKIETDIPEIKECGWYMQQGTPAYKGGITATPACYIEYLKIDTEPLGNKMQKATIPINIIVISDCLQDSDTRMVESANFAHLSIVSKVFEQLNGYSPMLSVLPEHVLLATTSDDYQVFTSPVRNSILTDHSNRSVVRTTQLFTTTAKDYAAVKTMTKVIKPLHINTFSVTE